MKGQPDGSTPEGRVNGKLGAKRTRAEGQGAEEHGGGGAEEDRLLHILGHEGYGLASRCAGSISATIRPPLTEPTHGPFQTV